MPTLNCEHYLENSLKSIRAQNASPSSYEILIVDAGSRDNTLSIAEKYGCVILHNPHKTADHGKLIGARHAKGEILAFIDSDNILPDSNWIQMMLAPFQDKDICAAEPLYYTWRKEDALITRYCALIGANDPLCLFTGNYDRFSLITNRWTELPTNVIEKDSYLEVTLLGDAPTMGSNGFFVRKHIFDTIIDPSRNYFFDIDFVYEMVQRGYNRIAKVKTGIIHIYTTSVFGFIKKQRRRVRDYLYFSQLRQRGPSWNRRWKGIIIFSVASILFFPTLIQSLIGYSRKQDIAWFFHPFACFLTFAVYSFYFLFSFIKNEPEPR